MSKNTSKKTKINISSYTLIMFMILLIGFSLRLLKFHYFSSLEADEGRDLLVARHIVQFDEHVLLGHHSAGIAGFYYGPYYYYFLAFLTYLFDHPYFIFLFITIWHSASSIFLFYIGKNLINPRTGLITAFLYSISLLMITTNNVWGAYISFQIFILAFLFFSFYFRYKHKSYLYIHILLLILALSMEYSQIILLPIFIFWLFCLDKSKEKSSLIKNIFIYVFVLCVSFTPQLIYFGPKIRNFFNSNNFLYNLPSFFSQLLILINSFFSSLFVHRTLLAILFILCILFPWYIIKLIKEKRKITVNEFIILITPAIGLLFSSIKPNVYPHHLLYLYIFCFLGLGLMVDRIVQKNKPVIILLLLFPIAGSLLIPNKLYYDSYKNNSLIEAEIVASAIKETISRYSLGDYLGDVDIVQNSNVETPTFFPGPEFYLFLEKQMDQTIINITQEVPFNYHPNNNAKYVFLICRTYLDNSFRFPTCFDSFIKDKSEVYAFKDNFYQSRTMKGYLFVRNSMAP